MTETLAMDLSRIRAARRLRKKKRFSRLDRHRAQIQALKQQHGASLSEIQAWLKQHARITVATSTILRALRRWSRPS